MRTIVSLVFIAAAAACGGGSSGSRSTAPEPEPPPSPCVPMAQHMREMVVKAGEAENAGPDMLAKISPIVERVVAERCQADAWSDDIIACVNAADETTMDPCIEQLTDEQEKALDAHIEREIDPVLQEAQAEAEAADGDGDDE